jgi:L-ribulose-5-phosphate 3-epimerase
VRAALEEVRRLGALGIELEAAGDLAPANLSQSGRRDIRQRVRSRDLEICALSCPLRPGLDQIDHIDARLEYVRQAMTLCYDLGAHAVIVPAGRIPEKEDDPRRPVLVDALRDLARHGDRVGTILALQTGLESGETLAAFLHTFDTGSLGVNFNPGNLLVAGLPVYDSARALRGRIVHVHATDARQTTTGRAALVPLGAGDVDWLYLLGVLEEIDFTGWLTLQREGSARPLEEMQAGVEFLKRLIL